MLHPEEKMLENLIRGHSDVLVYGNKSSGKTTFMKKILESTNTQYIYFNCILTDERSSFLELFNFEFRKFIQHKDEDIFNSYEFSKKFTQPKNLEAWILEFRKVGRDHKDVFKTCKNLYVFIDKIEQLTVSQKFLSSFYRACKKELIYIKFSFILSGITSHHQYVLEQPFRNIITFCIDKKSIKNIVHETIGTELKEKFNKKDRQAKDIGKLQDHLNLVIYNKFEILENSLDRMKRISSIIGKFSVEFIKNDIRKIGLLINSNELRDYINKVAEYGPIEDFLIEAKKQYIEIRKEGVENFYEYYPNLLLTAVHFAEAKAESEDTKRFFDYKKSRKNLRTIREKKPERHIRNNVQRIISIAEVLESQTKGKKQKQLEHHSLDFYGCIQYLIEENKLSYCTKNLARKAYGGKVIGKSKEEQVRFFVNKIDLQYSQFMG